MTSPQCVGEPISWLRLERYVLDELPDVETREVRTHLERCPVCRACEEEARRPRVLPALSASTVSPAMSRSSTRTPGEPRPTPTHEVWRRRLGLASSVLAAAAAVLFAVWPREPSMHTTPPGEVHTRGGDVALVLVREREGEITENPGAYVETDRFRVLVTCPPGHAEHVRVFVVQGDEASLALEGGESFHCGNRVPIEGAFRITDTAETQVCVVFGDVPAELAGAELARLRKTESSGALCRTLRPMSPSTP